MKRFLIPALACLVAPSILAQSAIDAFQTTQGDFKGTARFMSMGGAFTALGGDMSTLNQNPAGIGIYRRSEIGLTLDLNMQSATAENGGQSASTDQTKFRFNNIGYIGSSAIGDNSTFAWGVSYNRGVSFDHVAKGYAPAIQSSLSNYAAQISNGYTADELNFATGYNPYNNSSCDWLSILAYNSYMIGNTAGSNNRWQGMYQNGTSGSANMRVHEHGYLDEYSFSLGGSYNNSVYWGVALGINDLNYVREVTYGESLNDARVYNDNGYTTGSSDWTMSNYKHISGTGWNAKFGLIFKPVQQFRIGLAVHTPTWYEFDHNYDAEVSNNGNYEYTDVASFSWKLQSPWKVMVGAAAVLDDLIISADYQCDFYKDMSVKTAQYDDYGYFMHYDTDNYINSDIEDYARAANTIRIGAEYRVTRAFSVRAGYNYTTSNVSADYRDGDKEVITSGTDTSFSFDKSRQNVSVGFGYRWGKCALDMAYVHGMRDYTLKPYTDSTAGTAPTFSVKDKDNSVVLTLSYKF